MATLNFLIRDKKSKSFTAIYYHLNLSAKKKIRGSTKLKIHPKFWDENKQRVRNKAEVSFIKDTINSKLSHFENYIYKYLMEHNTLHADELYEILKTDIDIYFGKKAPEKKEVITFFPFVEKYIEQAKNKIVSQNNKPVSAGTIKEYKKTRDLLKEFEKEKNYKVTFDSINFDFYYAFIEFLEDKNYGLNTIGKFIKQLKVFLNDATERGINSNYIFRSKKFVKPRAESYQIYLNEKELKRLNKVDLKDNKKQERARDLFMIGAYTGLRVSDFTKLTKNNIKTLKGKEFIETVVQKTNKRISLPIHPELKKILKKYNGDFPKRMADQHINNEIKKIGEKAKINEPIAIKRIKGGKEISEVKPKYDLIVNHTARRSFITNAYLSGMSTLDIMSISGHTEEKTLLTYIKVGQAERALKIAESDFYKKEI